MKRFLWFNKRSMRSELSIYVLFLSLFSAFGFLVALDNYFISGLDMASRATMQMEVRSYDKKYQKDPNTPLINTHHMKFYPDNLDDVPNLYKQLFSEKDIQKEQFYEFEWSPNGTDEWEDSRYIIVYKHTLYDGRTIYVITDFEANLLTKEEQDHFDAYFERIFYFIGGFLMVVLSVVWFYNRRINRFTALLADWAEKINIDNYALERPDFRYSELNTIADQLKASYAKSAAVIEREHQFLRHSSHELRTPIAVIRSNIEFLEKVGVTHNLCQPVERINRASHTMLQLTQTLLWLSRESEVEPESTTVNVPELAGNLIDELSYLLQGKDVSLETAYLDQNLCHQIPLTPFRIVLSNLLRNAFQYTHTGWIKVHISEHTVSIENSEPDEEKLDNDNSFGLGLILVRKICERLNWEIEVQFKQCGVLAKLKIPQKN